MDQLKFGIIGTGRIITKFCRAFNEGLVSGGVILAVASRNPERAKEVAGANGISRAYGSYEELLEDRDIDIVYVAATNELHFSCCEKAIRAGKHILCEKPMTMCAAEARELSALAKKAGVFMMEALWTCYLPTIRKAQEWVREGRIGELRGIRASLCARREPAEYPRLYDPAKGGGAVLDLGIYGLQFARHFAGDRTLKECKSLLVPAASGTATGVDNSCFILLEYADGVVAEIGCSISFHAPNDAFVFGDTGYIRMGPWFNAARKIELFTLPFAGADNYRDPVPADEFSIPPTPGFEFEIAHAMECIRTGKTESDIVTLSKTIEAMEIIDRIRSPLV